MMWCFCRPDHGMFSVLCVALQLPDRPPLFAPLQLVHDGINVLGQQKGLLLHHCIHCPLPKQGPEPGGGVRHLEELSWHEHTRPVAEGHAMFLYGCVCICMDVEMYVSLFFLAVHMLLKY